MSPAAVHGSPPLAAHPPQVAIVIPARYASTRFPGKPLVEIGGRPMIEHVYRRAAATPGVGAVIVATDDTRIAAAVEGFGGVAVMTSPAHATGTDRVAEAVASVSCTVVVNVQGDEPLVEPGMIAEVMAPLLADATVPMSTLRQAIVDPADYASPHVVKVVVDRSGDALYFSRAPIPFLREYAGPGQTRTDGPGSASPAGSLPFKHIGMYAYRRDLLLWLAGRPRTPLEIAESLEQLRALEHGVRIRTVDTRFDAIGVDTPDDLERVRRRLQQAAPAAAQPAGGRGGSIRAAAHAREVA